MTGVRARSAGIPPATGRDGSHRYETRVYGVDMAFTLWLSAEEERILAKIMRAEGTRSKEQAVIKAIRDKGDLLSANLAANRPARETPETTDRVPGA